ncbi:MAG: response regulator transcription factor [Firmicutes bacterium]|nr:response regulator transcription factor [Bacillota bacterium]
MAYKILVVDDEQSIAEILKYSLEKEGYKVFLSFDGEDALKKIAELDPDLVLLDIMLPLRDGFQVCQEIRASRSRLPIIMLTAKEAEIDKVVGLEIGADDYITKPFSMREVIARVKAVLRRSAFSQRRRGTRLRTGGLEIDFNTMEVIKDGETVELSFREFTLLTFLMQQPNHIFTRKKLLNEVWGYDYIGEERTVDVMIRRLREKIEKNPAEPSYICTKRGVGYYFRRGSSV